MNQTECVYVQDVFPGNYTEKNTYGFQSLIDIESEDVLWFGHSQSFSPCKTANDRISKENSLDGKSASFELLKMLVIRS